MTSPDPGSSLLSDLERTIDEVFAHAELRALLASDRPLRIKYGVDCTAPFLHLGHAVNLWMMRRLQDAGHKVVFLLGDVTTAVGDPTGRTTTRPVLSSEEIEKNATAFLEQISLVLRTDDEVFEVRRNSEWYERMAVPEWLRLSSEVSVAHLMARDMFRRRLAEGQEIGMHEFAYPILQGYDSVVIDADLTIVGSDQLFNEMLARPLQERRGQRPQVVITSKITPGIHGGPKQSKSLGNYVALTDTPRDKFGKLMSLPDELVAQYTLVYTDLPLDLVAVAERATGAAARDAKLRLARAVVERYHGADVAEHEQEWFLSTFQRRQTPSNLPTVTVTGRSSVLALVRQARPELGSAEARRLVAQGAVRLDDTPVTDPLLELDVAEGSVLRVGRRHWFRIVGT